MMAKKTWRNFSKSGQAKVSHKRSSKRAQSCTLGCPVSGLWAIHSEGPNSHRCYVWCLPNTSGAQPNSQVLKARVTRQF